MPLPVYIWPDSADYIPLAQDLLVIAVHTPNTTLRTEARTLVRLALMQVLCKKLTCQPNEIKFISEAGQAIRLNHPYQNIGLSISHEAGLSLAAINMNGNVGVDLLATNVMLSQYEILTLANDYLGSKVVECLSCLTSSSQQNTAFTTFWVAHEAHLKYQNQALVEWIAKAENQLKNCTQRALQLSDGYIGAVAY